jgi:two-component system, sensor histidine kinase PdtaS
MVDGVSTGIPFEEARKWFASKPWASFVFVAALSILAVSLRAAIGPWIHGAEFVSFLPVVAAIAYLTGPNWAYFGLSLITALVWGLLSSKLSLRLGVWGDPADLAIFVITGIAVIEFVRLLDRALDSLQKERRRAMRLAEQRQALINELAHRTSNNLQMVSAMLQLARRTMADPAAQRALTEASERIRAMAMVQRHLSQDKGAGIELGDFLPSLCADLQTALGVPIASSIERLPPLSSKVISALALAVQEFAANAVEHGSRPEAQMALTVRIEKSGRDHGILIVDDNGRGLPADFDLAAVKSLGLVLVRAFVQDLSGSFDIRNRPNGSGVVASVRFPLKAAVTSGVYLSEIAQDERASAVSQGHLSSQ